MKSQFNVQFKIDAFLNFIYTYIYAVGVDIRGTFSTINPYLRNICRCTSLEAAVEMTKCKIAPTVPKFHTRHAYLNLRIILFYLTVYLNS